MKAGLRARGVAGLLVAGSCFWVCRGDAQEALRFSLAGERAAYHRRMFREQQPHAFKIGDAGLRWGAMFGAEWNDNVTLAAGETISDLILRPQASANLSWPITPANVLELAVTTGYSKYVEHSEFDRWFVLPGSVLAFDVFVRDVKITLEDRFSYQQDPAERAVVTGTAEFGGLENLAGVQALADLDDMMILGTYHHLLFVSTVSEFEHLDRSSHQLFARLTLEPKPFLGVGVEAGLTPTTYLDSFLRDNLSYSAGGFFELTPTKHIGLQGRGGAVLYHYDNAPGQAAAEEVQNFYFGLDLTHRPTKFLDIALSGGNESQLGVNQDLVELTYVRSTAQWTVSRSLTVRGDVLFEDGQESGLLEPEKFQRWGGGIAATWRFHRKWYGRLAYRFLDRDSEFPARDYQNHRVWLEISYRN